MKKLYLFIFLLPFLGFSQNSYFINLHKKDGLASDFTRIIYQDSYGYMWFGTDDGLNRYDGTNIATYRHQDSKYSLSDNYIKDIMQTSTGKLLICTPNMIDVFNYKTEKFEHLSFLENHDFESIIETNNKQIWALTENNWIVEFDSNLKMINRFDVRQLKGLRLPQDPKNVVKMFRYDGQNLMLYVNQKGFFLLNTKSKKINFITKDVLNLQNIAFRVHPINKSEFWITSGIGVYVFKDGVLSDKFIKGDTESGKNLNNNFVSDLKKMPNGEIWLFTDGGGINVYNTSTKKFRYILNNINDEFSVGSNFIYTSYIDRNSTLWLGTIKNGVSQLDNANPYKTYKLRFKSKDIESEVPVSSLFLDSNNTIWVGSDGNGLYKFENGKIKHVLFDESIRTIPSINQIATNILILGTYKNGISTYNMLTGKLTKQKNIDNQLDLNFKITFIKKDYNGKLWIGGNKILQLEPNSLIPNPDFTSNTIRALSFCKQSKDTSFIGTRSGFYRHARGKFELISDKPQMIKAICRYKNNKYWLATDKGICLIDVITKKIQFYGIENGLNNKRVNSLLLDDSNNLWLGTSQGISRFDVATKKFNNFTYEDGFSENSFENPISIKDNHGRLFFGGVKGLLVNNAKGRKLQKKPNKVLFTKLLVNHEELATEDVDVLNTPIEEAESITLNNKQKVITIYFSSFDFKYTKNIQFQYKLDGYSKDWITTNYRNLTFMNLDPGNYTLKVKASTSSGLWDESYSSIKIKVLPAWWQTIWFKLCCIGLIGFAIHRINRNILKRERLKRDFEFEKKSLEDQKELDQKHLQFFTNLSHEIRTPLSLILSPVESIIKEEVSPNVRNNLSLIQNNVLRINRLINRSVDFRKTQFKEPEIQAVYKDIVLFLKEIASAFENFSTNKNIQLVFSSKVNSQFVWFDPYMVESIFYNLLSNAFKYSHTGGKVLLKIKMEEDLVQITVKDNGQGISPEDLPHIFEVFYQSKNHVGGSGIGLALTKEFVESHHGTIKAESTIGKGSSFIVTFRLGNAHFDMKNLVNQESAIVEVKPNNLDSVLDVKLKTKTILIVEDEDSLRDYLAANLSQNYIIVTSANGLQAIEMLGNKKIDLIVTDLMMPNLNGIELCKLVKENIKTCDIPIVMLTARALNEDKIEGYNVGADAYIEKPFQLDLLISVINNLLKGRIRQNNKILEDFNIPTIPETINSSDQKFYDEIMLIIEKNIENADFDIPMFAKELGMSKSLIYKKMGEITDLSVKDLMLAVRLNKASQILIYTTKPIEEISMLVGFKNAKHFSTSFKKKFGVTPSNYREDKLRLNKHVEK